MEEITGWMKLSRVTFQKLQIWFRFDCLRLHITRILIFIKPILVHAENSSPFWMAINILKMMANISRGITKDKKGSISSALWTTTVVSIDKEDYSRLTNVNNVILLWRQDTAQMAKPAELVIRKSNSSWFCPSMLWLTRLQWQMWYYIGFDDKVIHLGKSLTPFTDCSFLDSRFCLSHMIMSTNQLSWQM